MKEAKDTSFNPNVQIVHHISSIRLIKEGWERVEKAYIKNGKEIKYDGCNWYLDGKIIEFMEDVKQENK